MVRFKKQKQKEFKEFYVIAFCDENDLSTKFGEYNATFDTYFSADHTIRMGWRKEKSQKIKDGYQIRDSWLIIEKKIEEVK